MLNILHVFYFLLWIMSLWDLQIKYSVFIYILHFFWNWGWSWSDLEMPGSPHLAPFDVEEQRLCSESLPNDQAPHPISKREPSHIMSS